MSLGKLRDFVRARLWRHMFLWFGMTILASVVTTSFISTAMHRWSTEPAHRRFGEGLQVVAFHAGQAWEDPNALHAVLQNAQATFHSGILLQDHEHHVIDKLGDCHPGQPPEGDSFLHEMERHAPGTGRPMIPGLMGGHHVPPPFAFGEHIAMVTHHDEPVGWLVICAMPPPPMPPAWRLAMPLVVLVLMLGAAAYRVAQGLTRPLADLARVTRSIGAGALASRVALDERPPGEVGQLAQAINDMAAKIEKQIGDQRTLLAMVSHELRTPLARMRLLVELAQDASQTPRVLAEIENEVISIDNIVGALLANARLEFAIVHRQSTDAEQLLRRAFANRAPPPDIVVAAGGDWTISGDITLLVRALANIIDNADKYGRGVKSARLRREDDHVVFEIFDQGDGFGDDIARVFEPFVRSPQAETLDPTSMGLGLSLVKRVAEAHAGTAWCQNVPEGGACVAFSVKVVPAGG